jgi:hypothetical protein
MDKVELNAENVCKVGCSIFDRCFYQTKALGLPFGTPDFAEEFNEALVCAGLVWWYRALDAAPVLRMWIDPRDITRAIMGPEHRKEVYKILGKARDELERWASFYRSAHLDDLGHLYRQSIRDFAGPRLALAQMMIGMMPTPYALGLEHGA